jgi:L-lactate dehydrogenase complex protein LldG
MADNARQNILNRIKQALSNPVPLPFPDAEKQLDNSVFQHPKNSDEIKLFAETFEKLQGKFIYCSNESDLENNLLQLISDRCWSSIYFREPSFKKLLTKINIETCQDLSTCDVAITDCEFLIARTGSIMMSSHQESGRTVSVYAPIHICIAQRKQIVYDIENAIEQFTLKYKENIPSFITLASGPSRTADIEKTLVTGVHGPKEVFCFFIDN